MILIDRTSLAQTVDLVNEAVFFHEPMGLRQRGILARWVATRYDHPGAYAGTFALFENERRAGVRLFTGEKVKAAAARHIAGEEACRALRLLNVQDQRINDALDGATDKLAQRLGPPKARPRVSGRTDWLARYGGGTYCCGPCSAALWRHINAGGFDDPELRLAIGLKCLHHCRRGDGQWRVFPFWYTLSALIEIDQPAARAEIRYAAPVLKRAVERAPSSERYSRRRREIARRALSRI